MNCFPCFRSQKSKKSRSEESSNEVMEATEAKKQRPSTSDNNNVESNAQVENKNINAQTFTFRELASATRNFRQETLLGEGGFGRVYKGTLAGSGQVVAVKQLDRNGLQGNKEFLVEVLMLSQLHHEHLVKLVGYCADGDQRLLVYEYMPGGSVEDHLLDLKEGVKPLDWKTRMKIAFGAAQGLEYLHATANPPVIYRDLKSSNILLCDDFHPKLSDFGLAKLSPAGDSKMHMSSRVMGTYGYCAPEYSRNGHLTVKSDVYSFGVVLLELITGRRAVDTTKPVNEQNLVSWAQPIFRDPKRFPDMADPLLNKQFPETGLNQAVAIAAMCLQEEPGARPLMSDVMTALSFLANAPDTPAVPCPAPVPPPTEEKSESNGADDQDTKKSDVKKEDSTSDEEEEDGSDYDDGESGGHEDANSTTNSVDNSDDYSDCSDYQETENTVEEPTKEHQKSIKKNSISSRKHSRKSSIKEGNESSKINSQDRSTTSSDRSSSGSEESGKSSRKKSPSFSLRRKSSKTSKADGCSKPSKNPNTNKSLSSKSYKKSKKTKEVPATLSLKKPLDVRDCHKNTHQDQAH